MSNMLKSTATKKPSAGKVVNVTDIFDEDTQNAIKNIELFLQQVVKDKMYWTRDILAFF